MVVVVVFPVPDRKRAYIDVFSCVCVCACVLEFVYVYDALNVLRYCLIPGFTVCGTHTRRSRRHIDVVFSLCVCVCIIAEAAGTKGVVCVSDVFVCVFVLYGCVNSSTVFTNKNWPIWRSHFGSYRTVEKPNGAPETMHECALENLTQALKPYRTTSEATTTAGSAAGKWAVEAAAAAATTTTATATVTATVSVGVN